MVEWTNVTFQIITFEIQIKDFLLGKNELQCFSIFFLGIFSFNLKPI